MRVHYIHIGKTGGTAIKHALKETQLFKDKALELHPHKTKLSDIPLGEKVIFSLRDPLSRFFSAFHSRQRKGMPRYNSEWSVDEKKAFNAFLTPTSLLEAACNKNDARLNEKAILALQQIQHVKDHYSNWLVSLDYLESRKSDILHIAFQETLNNDFETIKEKLGLCSELQLPKSPINAHRNPAYEIPELTSTQSEFIHSWYEVDYSILNYCKNKF